MANEIADVLNRIPGWDRELGLEIVAASKDEVVAEWDVTPKQHQAYGIVHGGVYCGVIETVASIGAALVAMSRNQRTVGLENNTSFVRAVREGRLRAIARPVTRGRTTQVWEAWIRDAEERLVAQGRVRLLCLNVDETLGEKP
jgi:1,4-dihydroxy-2-naphthoyl-CoA hydrolase